MGAVRLVKSVPVGLAGLVFGGGAVVLVIWLLGDRPAPGRAERAVNWVAETRHGAWTVECRPAHGQQRKVCRLQARWGDSGAVHHYPVDGAWHLVSEPGATAARVTIDDNAPTRADCSTMCVFPGGTAATLSRQTRKGHKLVVQAVTSTGRETGGSIALDGFADALSRARTSVR